MVLVHKEAAAIHQVSVTHEAESNTRLRQCASLLGNSDFIMALEMCGLA